MLEKMKNNPHAAKVLKGGLYIVYIMPYMCYTHCIVCVLVVCVVWSCVNPYRRGQNIIDC
nr:MAG TPA: hypothetical protein [Caudoviricetes sp.]